MGLGLQMIMLSPFVSLWGAPALSCSRLKWMLSGINHRDNSSQGLGYDPAWLRKCDGVSQQRTTYCSPSLTLYCWRHQQKLECSGLLYCSTSFAAFPSSKNRRFDASKPSSAQNPPNLQCFLLQFRLEWVRRHGVVWVHLAAPLSKRGIYVYEKRNPRRWW